MSFDANTSDDSSEASNSNNNEEMERLQRECKAMVKLLKRLREEEQDWREKNEMLAREALVRGFQIENLEGPPPKRRLKAPAVKKEDK